MINRPLHVAWDNAAAGRSRTGTGVYASHLIRELSSDPELQFEVFHGWNVGRGSNRFVTRKIRSLSVLLWNHWYLAHTLRRKRFDVLHGPAFVVPLPCPCASVVTIHDISFRIFPEHFDSGWRSYVTSMMPSLIDSVSAIISVSYHSKQELMKYYNVAEDKIHVVYNGIDHARFHPAASLDMAWARSAGLRENYILHVGDLSGRKNIPMLLRAVARLRSSGRLGQRQLVLVGPETPGMVGAAEIHETIRNFDLSRTVVLLGRVADEHMPGLYRNASLVVMPSLYEGFGFPVVESMATGTPVVASNTSSLPEVAGDAALLVPPSDELVLAQTIDEVISSPKVRAELRERGLARAQNFDWKRTASETVAVYRKVAQ